MPAVKRYCPLCEREVLGHITEIEKKPYFSCNNGHRSLIKDEIKPQQPT